MPEASVPEAPRRRHAGAPRELPEGAQGRLRVGHLEEVAALATEDGIWMNLETWLVGGRKPAA